MHFDLTRPCDNCPFLKKGGIRLTEDRVREIAGAMLDSQGATFACHKTTVYAATPDGGEDLRSGPQSRHCAGALIFAEKHETATQAMRIAERLGWYDHRAFTSDPATVASVFDSLAEMMEANRRWAP
jgi:hypothetical protein